MKSKKIGNQNAAKADPANANIHIRATHTDKSKWTEAAKQQGMSLSTWIKNRLSNCVEKN